MSSVNVLTTPGLICLILCTTVVMIESESNSERSFILLSDIHLDLFYDADISRYTDCRSKPDQKEALFSASFGRLGCDPPSALLEEALQDISKVGASADFMVITGDLAGHNLADVSLPMANSSIRHMETFRRIRELLDKYLPNMKVYPTLGNNDYPVSYIQPEPEYFQSVLEVWEPLITRGETANEDSLKRLRETFSSGGYYSWTSAKEPKLKLISLNTISWTTRWFSRGNTNELGDQMLLWLTAELKDSMALGQKVYIASHVPPGLDVFYQTKPDFWLKNYTMEYMTLTGDTYASVIAAQLYGHTHRAEWRLFDANSDLSSDQDYQNKTQKKLSLMLVSPGLSPIYSNNPSYTIFDFSRPTYVPLEAYKYFMDLAASTLSNKTIWSHELDFKKNYKRLGANINQINPTDFLDVVEKLVDPNSGQVFYEYLHHIASYLREDPNPSRYEVFCGIRSLYSDQYRACMSRYVNIPG